MSAEKLYVMSATCDQARTYAESKGVSGPTGLRWINRAEYMRGLRDIELHVLPTARRIPEFWYLMELAAAQNFKIIKVSRDK